MSYEVMLARVGPQADGTVLTEEALVALVQGTGRAIQVRLGNYTGEPDAQPIVGTVQRLRYDREKQAVFAVLDILGEPDQGMPKWWPRR